MLNVFLQHKVRLFCVSTIGAIVVFIYASFQPKQYRASTLLYPNIEQGNKPLSNLAQLAGLHSQAGSKDKNRFIAILKSHEFIINFIEQQKLSKKLFSSKIDDSTGGWKDGLAPSKSQLVDAFLNRLSVSEDKQTGFVTVSIDWENRHESVALCTALVYRLNKFLRSRAVKMATISLTYLEKEIAAVSTLEVRHVMYSLMATYVKEKTLANVQEEYAFTTLSKPTLMDEYAYIKPRKKLMAFFAFFGVGMIYFGWLLFLSTEQRRADE